MLQRCCGVVWSRPARAGAMDRRTDVIMKTCQLRPTAIGAAALLSLCIGGARADVVTDWNVTALGVTETSPPPVEMRTMAITHAAIFDAVNAVTRTHKPYLVQPAAPQGSSQDAAAAGAAHGVLIWLHPGSKPALDAALSATLAKVPDGTGKDGGLAVGREVALKYIAARTNDGTERKPNYTLGTGAGKWQPTFPGNLAFASVIWADVKPFVLVSSTEVTAPGPLALDSAQYVRDLDEVRRVGAKNSKERSSDQTAAAIFSVIKPAQLWGAAARTAVIANGSSVIDNARTFALMQVAGVDGFITGWAIKKQHSLWRPITAIRQAATNADPNWTSLLVTPNHPDYVSGHCIVSGAMAEALRLVLGNDGVPFSATFAGNLSRNYENLTQAEKEIGDARVWAGIHTRTADDHGAIAGHKIAELVVQRMAKLHAL
jgi:hypothetical protein